MNYVSKNGMLTAIHKPLTLSPALGGSLNCIVSGVFDVQGYRAYIKKNVYIFVLRGRDFNYIMAAYTVTTDPSFVRMTGSKTIR
jgi:hypothetical protein